MDAKDLTDEEMSNWAILILAQYPKYPMYENQRDAIIALIKNLNTTIASTQQALAGHNAVSERLAKEFIAKASAQQQIALDRAEQLEIYRDEAVRERDVAYKTIDKLVIQSDADCKHWFTKYQTEQISKSIAETTIIVQRREIEQLVRENKRNADTVCAQNEEIVKLNGVLGETGTNCYIALQRAELDKTNSHQD